MCVCVCKEDTSTHKPPGDKFNCGRKRKCDQPLKSTQNKK